MQNIYVKNITKSSKFDTIVSLSNGIKLVINNDIIFKYSLTEKKKLTQKEITIIEEEQELIDSKQVAYKYATFKPRTEFEVINKLKSKGFSKESINRSIEFLNKNKLLDDVQFTKSYILEKFKLKSWVGFRLKNELQKKGISNSLFENIYPKLIDQQKEYDRGLDIAQKRLKRIKTNEKLKTIKSLSSYLQRQGYDFEIISRILDALFEQSDL